MALTKFRGAVFDLDGVITGTAKVHALAWESMFNDYLKRVAERENMVFEPFDRDDDYLQYVDGKPRPEGVRSFLKSRNINLPFGDLDDPPSKETVCGLGNRKNIDFQKVLRREGPDVFDSSVRLVRELRERGVRVAVASSSRNCGLILELGGLEGLFEARVDGEVSRERNLKGKPDPDIFVEAAGDMGLLPGECIIVEDAISGVQAGRKGNFGLVLGVARNIDGASLLRNGADLVVEDLSEVRPEDIEEWFEEGIEEDGWSLTYRGFEPAEEKLRETLTTVGNGYLGTRGCFEGESASDVHYPGTYIAGVYNKLASEVQGKKIVNNDFVNAPNWLVIELGIGTGETVSPLAMELLDYRQTLHMREAVLERSMVCRDRLGRITRIRSRRIASMADPHLCAIQYAFTPVNYSGRVTLRSALDGTVVNAGVARYRQLRSKHLSGEEQGKGRGGIFLLVGTVTSKVRIALHAKTAFFEDGKPLPVKKRLVQKKAWVAEEALLDVREGVTYTVEKIVSLFTSLDRGVSNPGRAAASAIARARSFKSLLGPHARAWESLWERADIRIDGDRFVQRAARLHVYHLLVTASPHNRDIDAGMPARGLHGEAYRGHIFWDELYILPFFNLRFPDISKALLMYRFRRLGAAKKYARENGYEGAMYPWQTADGGDEETQVVHYNPKSDSWGPDLSRRQRHVSIAVFYNVWKYVSDTDDRSFLREAGAEMMLEIARFWSSISRFDEGTGRFHIEGVMGPDEFHEKLPGSEDPGIRDNAYTNVMVVWLLEKALELVMGLPKKTVERLRRRTGLKIAEIERWKEITNRMNVRITDGNILHQFDGYMDLEELDWDLYRKKYGDIHRTDRILKAEGDSPDGYKVAKQADTLMMFYILAPWEVRRILNRLGIPVSDGLELVRNNYAYYEKRTSHGSTLSKVVHAVISSYNHESDTAWDWFLEAMESDVFDTQGGTTIEGIHCGVMAGTLDIITRYFAGVDVSGPVVEIHPHLPGHWRRIAFRIRHRKSRIEIEITKNGVKAKLLGKGKKRLLLKILGKNVTLPPGKARSVRV